MIRLPAEEVEEPTFVSLDLDQQTDTSLAEWTKSEDHLRCRVCSLPITRSRWAIQREGAFEHRFRNPDGWSFQVGCYRQAIGALVLGEPTLDDSWFSSYSWCYAVCGRCGTHLGWWYIGPDIFAGLIVTRLQSARGHYG